MINAKYKLVCTTGGHNYSAGQVLTQSSEKHTYGGPWGVMQQEGSAEWVENVPTAEEIAQSTLSALESAIDNFMDSKAQALGFKDRHSFALRAGITGSSWHTKAQTFGAWMDSVNDYCYQVKLDCQSGTRQVPTEEQLIAELPKLTL